MFLELFLMAHKASMLVRTLKNTRKGMGLCKVLHTKSQFLFIPVAASACSLLIPPHCRTHIRSMINSARFLDTQHTTQTLLYGGHVSSRSPFVDSFTLPSGISHSYFGSEIHHCPLSLQGTFSVVTWLCWRLLRTNCRSSFRVLKIYARPKNLLFFSPSSTAWREGHTSGKSGRQD